MKKLLILTPYLSGLGGTETVVAKLIKLFMENNTNYKIKLIVVGGSADKRWLENIEYEGIQFSSNRYIRLLQNTIFLIPYIFFILIKEKPDVVLSLHSILCVLVNKMRFFQRKKYTILSWIHYSLDQENVKKDLLHHADYHLAISPGIKKQFEDLGMDADSVFIVNNPVDPQVGFVRTNPSKKKFVYMGRIEYEGQKNIKELLSVLKELEGDWEADIYGDGPDISLCKEITQQYGIDDKVKWHGFIKEPWNEINEATALILTSTSESFGMVLAEAISNGVFCVSSNCKTGPQDIISKENGVLYELGNTEELLTILKNIDDHMTVIQKKEEIKKSITTFYSANYFSNFIKILDRIT